ncbi:MAG: hypothetical protein QG597_381 [Actinomycetota bacterium]|nr:hypothetical protein [Actinomycetota bacterium]
MSVEETSQLDVDIDYDLSGEDDYIEPQQARLFVARLDPWSVMKTAFVISIGLAIVTVVAMVLLWGVLAALGVYSSVNDTIESVAGASSSGFNVEEIFGFGRVVGGALVLAAVNVVLVTVLATLFAFMYNLTVPFTRGFEVTLSEE